MAKLDFDAASDEPIGKELGPYRLVRRLGVGGMAETFEAIRQGPSGFAQRVCLKLVLPFFREDEEFVKLFEQEARLAAKLRHSNIVGVIDFGQIGGRSYMALELVDGVDLQVLLNAQNGKRLTPEQVALLGHELAAALEHAHHPPRESDFDGSRVNAIVHRDISPSNVLISRHGEILLTDFGVAKAVTGSSRKQSAVKGKIPYMSPEQLRAEPIDGRADLFGVGVVLFEALAGQRPFEGAHDPATIMLILQGDHPPLSSLAPGAPPGLCDVIERLIEPDRDARPASAAVLIDLLDEFVPSPRVRRQLGTMVAELRPEREAPASGYPAARGEAATMAQQDTTDSEREKRTSGIVGAGESRARMQELSSAPSTEQPVSRGAQSTDARRRRQVLLAGAAAVALLIAAGAALWWRQGDRTEPPLGPPAAATEAASPAPPESAVPAPEPTAIATPADANADARADAVEQRSEPRGSSAEASDSGESPASEATTARQESESTQRPTVPGAPEKKRTARDTRAAAVAPADLTVVVFPWGNVWINGKSRGPAPLKNASLKPGRYRISVGRASPTESQSVRLHAGERKTLQFDLTK